MFRLSRLVIIAFFSSCSLPNAVSDWHAADVLADGGVQTLSSPGRNARRGQQVKTVIRRAKSNSVINDSAAAAAKAAAAKARQEADNAERAATSEEEVIKKEEAAQAAEKLAESIERSAEQEMDGVSDEDSVSSASGSTASEEMDGVSDEDSVSSASGSTASEDLTDFKQHLLDYHNRFRCMHGAPPVTWNEDVAQGAKVYIADKTSMQHDDSYSIPPPRGPAGENLAWRRPTMDAKRAVQDWYEEVNDCVGGPTGFQDGCKRGAGGKATGHFTAVVWKGVSQIGCALNNENTILICRYWSGDTKSSRTANMGGGFTANVLPQVKSADECHETSDTGAHTDIGAPLAPPPGPPEPPVAPAGTPPVHPGVAPPGTPPGSSRGHHTAGRHCRDFDVHGHMMSGNQFSEYGHATCSFFDHHTNLCDAGYYWRDVGTPSRLCCSCGGGTPVTAEPVPQAPHPCPTKRTTSTTTEEAEPDETTTTAPATIAPRFIPSTSTTLATTPCHTKLTTPRPARTTPCKTTSTSSTWTFANCQDLPHQGPLLNEDGSVSEYGDATCFIFYEDTSLCGQGFYWEGYGDADEICCACGAHPPLQQPTATTTPCPEMPTPCPARHRPETERIITYSNCKDKLVYGTLKKDDEYSELGHVDCNHFSLHKDQCGQGFHWANVGTTEEMCCACGGGTGILPGVAAQPATEHPPTDAEVTAEVHSQASAWDGYTAGPHSNKFCNDPKPAERHAFLQGAMPAVQDNSMAASGEDAMQAMTPEICKEKCDADDHCGYVSVWSTGRCHVTRTCVDVAEHVNDDIVIYTKATG